jgi:hypothetical protein
MNLTRVETLAKHVLALSVADKLRLAADLLDRHADVKAALAIIERAEQELTLVVLTTGKGGPM